MVWLRVMKDDNEWMRKFTGYDDEGVKSIGTWEEACS